MTPNLAAPGNARCNICNGSEFSAMNGRPNVHCVRCGSVERTRIIMAVLKAELPITSGMSILHIAPEKGLAEYFKTLPDVKYRPVDLFPRLYKHSRVEQMDLVTD